MCNITQALLEWPQRPDWINDIVSTNRKDASVIVFITTARGQEHSIPVKVGSGRGGILSLRSNSPSKARAYLLERLAKRFRTNPPKRKIREQLEE